MSSLVGRLSLEACQYVFEILYCQLDVIRDYMSLLVLHDWQLQLHAKGILQFYMFASSFFTYFILLCNLLDVNCPWISAICRLASYLLVNIKIWQTLLYPNLFKEEDRKIERQSSKPELLTSRYLICRKERRRLHSTKFGTFEGMGQNLQERTSERLSASCG